MTIRAVLDASAIRAYAAGSLDVGELIGEFSDEGVQFGLPVVCLAEAATGASPQTLAMLNLSVCVFYCGTIRGEATDWLLNQVRAIAILPPPTDPEDRPRNVHGTCRAAAFLRSHDSRTFSS